MKYRKIFALLLAAATLFSLAACGETAAGPEATPDPALDESAATVSGQTLTFAGASTPSRRRARSISSWTASCTTGFSRSMRTST